MPDSRTTAALAKLRKWVPLPVPTTGWLAAFQASVAETIGVWLDDQATGAELEMLLPAKLTKADANGWAEGTEYKWAFDWSPTVGADGKWLDLWGRTLGVSRIPQEPDQDYSRRILAMVFSPSTTNRGMASAIDRILQVKGTAVLDAVDAISATRANADWISDGTLAYATQANLLDSDPDGQFVVTLPAITAPYTVSDIYTIADKLKAAGTKCARVIVATTCGINIATAIAPGASGSASITGASDAETFTWTITGGSITAGQGTRSITYTAGASGTVDIGCTVAKSGSYTFTPSKSVQIAGVTAPSTAPAGKMDNTATMTAVPGGAYSWAISGGIIVSGQGTNSIVYAVGQSGSTITLNCTVTVGGQNFTATKTTTAT